MMIKNAPSFPAVLLRRCIFCGHVLHQMSNFFPEATTFSADRNVLCCDVEQFLFLSEILSTDLTNDYINKYGDKSQW